MYMILLYISHNYYHTSLYMNVFYWIMNKTDTICICTDSKQKPKQNRKCYKARQYYCHISVEKAIWIVEVDNMIVYQRSVYSTCWKAENNCQFYWKEYKQTSFLSIFRVSSFTIIISYTLWLIVCHLRVKKNFSSNYEERQLLKTINDVYDIG
jgi:hypothetical protein